MTDDTPETLAASVEAGTGRKLARPITVHIQTSRNVVLETGDGLIIRAGDSRGGSSYSREIRLLEAVRRHSPVAVPSPWLFAEPSERYSAGIWAHEKVPGVPIPSAEDGVDPRDSLCAEVARFVTAIHGIPETKIANLDLPVGRLSEEALAGIFADVKEPVQSHANGDWADGLDQFWARVVEDVSAGLSGEVLLHGDLWHSNLLTDDEGGRLTGVIDWEDAFLGDPAVDFAALVSAGRGFLDRVVRYYEAENEIDGENFRRRIDAVIVVRLLSTIRYHFHDGNDAGVAKSVTELRQLYESYG